MAGKDEQDGEEDSWDSCKESRAFQIQMWRPCRSAAVGGCRSRALRENQRGVPVEQRGPGGTGEVVQTVLSKQPLIQCDTSA